MVKEKIDLNAPAFGKDAQKLEAEATAEPAEVSPAKVGEDTTSSEESKVPYSRFKKFHDRALEAEEEAAKWREEALRYKEPIREQTNTGDVPGYWTKLYGDSDAAKEAWFVQKQANEELRAEARRDALEAIRTERYEEAARTEQNVEVLDENFDDLSAFIGRELSDKEQSDILDIIDDYTPKDRDGNYAGAIMPFDKAWEVYELKNGASKAPRTAARNNIAGLTGTQSEGSTQLNEANKNFNPLDWNAWKSRLN